MPRSSQQVELVGTSAWSANVRQRIASLSQRVLNVLVTGPEGSGKKLIARALHAASVRGNYPLIQVDCPTLSGLVAESQLFGHLAGGFAFASGAALGCLRAAEGGVLLLVGVDQLDLSTQVRLREALANRQVTPLGGSEPLPINVQVVATSECDLGDEVAAGTFDYQLYELLSAASLETVALEERPEDVVALAEHFLAATGTENRKTLTASAVDWMRSYPWPGNVSQLKDLVERIAGLPQATIDFQALRSLGPPPLRRSEPIAGFVPQRRFGGFAALRRADHAPCGHAPHFARRCNRRSA